MCSPDSSGSNHDISTLFNKDHCAHPQLPLKKNKKPRQAYSLELLDCLCDSVVGTLWCFKYFSWGVVVHSVSSEIKIKAFRQEFLLLLQGGTPSADAASVLLELSRKHPGGWETGHLLQVFISVLPVNASNNHKEIALFGLSRIGRSEVLFLGPLGGPAPEICKRRFQEGPSGMFTLGVSQE